MGATVALQGQELGTYSKQTVADIAVDVALLLKQHFSAKGTNNGGPGTAAGASLPPKLRALGVDATIQELLERPEWAAMAGCASLADALRQLATSGLAEQLYYELYSASSDRSAEGGEQESEEGENARQLQQAQPAQEDRPLQQQAQKPLQQASQQAQQQAPAPAPELMPTPPRQEPAVVSAAAASMPKPTSSSGADCCAAADAANSLKALAAAAWGLQNDTGMEEGEASDGGGASWNPLESEEEGGSTNRTYKRRHPVPRRVPADTQPVVRRQRAAKLWCRHPLDAAQWALVLSQSAIDSRNISLPWTNPGDMAAELLGSDWVKAVRVKQQLGTLRKSAVLVEAGEGGAEEREREVVYALYARINPKKDTRPQYIEKLHPLLLRYGAGVGDVLLLLPLAPGRLRAMLLKAHTEEARAVHNMLGFDVPGEQQAWRNKHTAAATARQPGRAMMRQRLEQQQEETPPPPVAPAAGAPAAAAGAIPQQAAAAAVPPQDAAAATFVAEAAATMATAAFREAIGRKVAAHHKALATARPSAATAATTRQRESEQEAAAGAVEEMMPHHKRPKWEHPIGDGEGSQPLSPGGTPPASRDAHRHAQGLQALLKPPEVAQPGQQQPWQQQQQQAAVQEQRQRLQQIALVKHIHEQQRLQQYVALRQIQEIQQWQHEQAEAQQEEAPGQQQQEQHQQQAPGQAAASDTAEGPAPAAPAPEGATAAAATTAFTEPTLPLAQPTAGGSGRFQAAAATPAVTAAAGPAAALSGGAETVALPAGVVPPSMVPAHVMFQGRPAIMMVPQHQAQQHQQQMMFTAHAMQQAQIVEAMRRQQAALQAHHKEQQQQALGQAQAKQESRPVAAPGAAANSTAAVATPSAITHTPSPTLSPVQSNASVAAAKEAAAWVTAMSAPSCLRPVLIKTISLPAASAAPQRPNTVTTLPHGAQSLPTPRMMLNTEQQQQQQKDVKETEGPGDQQQPLAKQTSVVVSAAPFQPLLIRSSPVVPGEQQQQHHQLSNGKKARDESPNQLPPCPPSKQPSQQSASAAASLAARASLLAQAAAAAAEEDAAAALAAGARVPHGTAPPLPMADLRAAMTAAIAAKTAAAASGQHGAASASAPAAPAAAPVSGPDAAKQAEQLAKPAAEVAIPLSAPMPAHPSPGDSLARMQLSLQQFASAMAARVGPGEQQVAQMAGRLHTLATRLDALLGDFWKASG